MHPHRAAFVRVCVCDYCVCRKLLPQFVSLEAATDRKLVFVGRLLAVCSRVGAASVHLWVLGNLNFDKKMQLHANQ